MKSPKATPLSEAEIKKTVRPERYAEILAHLLHYRDSDPSEVVRRLGLSPEVWSQADAFWAEELSLGIQRQQRELALRFSSALGRARVRLVAKGLPLSAIGTLDTPAPVPEAAAKDAPPPETPASSLLPSFMAAKESPAPVAAPLPLTPAPVAAPLPPTPAPVAAPLPPTPAPVAAPKPRTIAMPAMAPDERRVFSDGVAPDVALRNALQHAEATQGSKPSASLPVGLTEPAQADQIAAIAKRLMPFGPTGAPPPTHNPKAPSSAEPATAADPSASIPLERHASLHVDLSLRPEQRADILQRYGLSAEQFARVDGAYRARMAQDAGLRAAWESACSRYRLWLSRAKPQP